MTLQKTSSIKLAAIFVVGISIIGVVLSLATYSCGLNHLLITTDLQKNEISFEPEFCMGLIERIDIFNENCDQEFEIIDCG